MVLQKVKLLIVICLGLISTTWASEPEVAAHGAESHNVAEEFNPTEVIMHHIADAHDWHLFEKTDKETGQKIPVSIPLPVILVYQGKVDVFMSSAFHHGHSSVKKQNREYLLHHGKIYVAKNGELQFDEHGHALNPKPIDLSITKNVASMMVSAILLLSVFIPMARKYKKGNMVPSGIQGFMEPIVLFIKDDIAIPNIGEHKYKRYLPYLITAFFFIWFNNMLGLLPTGANLTGNIAVTMVLAVFTMLITNFSGNKNYWKHVFATPGVPIWLSPIMIPVELIGILSKPFALMIRLFANITAGHIIVLSLISLIFIFKTVWISPVSIAFTLFIDILELLVAILQAYIFTLLSALFIGLAVQEHHHPEHTAEAHH
jgi:F-type H+-transporting ATPase subunit a